MVTESTSGNSTLIGIRKPSQQYRLNSQTASPDFAQGIIFEFSRFIVALVCVDCCWMCGFRVGYMSGVECSPYIWFGGCLFLSWHIRDVYVSVCAEKKVSIG